MPGFEKKKEEFESTETWDSLSQLALRPPAVKIDEVLTALTEDRGYTLSEIADIASHSYSTVAAWSRGRRSAEESTCLSLIQIFNSPNVQPSAKTLRKMSDDHHLSWDKWLGWRFRFTIDLGRKKVGKRINLRLRTFDKQEAIRRRDVVLAYSNILGLKIAGRMQKRTS